MPGALSDATRFAVYTVWPKKCVWCARPLSYREMQIEHLVPKSLADTEAKDSGERAKVLAQLIAKHDLPSDFDVFCEENLAPSCGPCNSFKADIQPPNVVGLILARAETYAPSVRKAAATAVSKQKLENALGILSTANLSDPAFAELVQKHRPEIESLLAAVGIVENEVDLGAGMVASVHVSGEWRVTSQLSNGVEVVADATGKKGGYTGPGFGFQCPYCGRQGPWNGIVCMSCYQRSEPD